MSCLKIVVLASILLLLTMDAQSIVIRDRLGNVVNNDTLTYSPGLTQKPPFIEIQCYFFAQNTDTTTMDMGVKKTEFILSANVDHGICFGQVCYQSSVFVVPVGQPVLSGQIDSTFSGTYRYLASSHTPATDLVAYTFYDRNDPADSAVVYVVYNTQPPTGVTEAAVPRENEVRLFPIPADRVVNFLFKSSAGTSSTLVIINPLGQLMHDQKVDNSKRLVSLNTGLWSNGRYYYVLYSNNGARLEGSFIVNHTF